MQFTVPFQRLNGIGYREERWQVGELLDGERDRRERRSHENTARERGEVGG